MRRWVRYQAAVMVCVDVDDSGYDGDLVAVVIADDHEDFRLACDHAGDFLVYDETMERAAPTNPTKVEPSPSPNTATGSPA